jgi:hypothetical protein
VCVPLLVGVFGSNPTTRRWRGRCVCISPDRSDLHGDQCDRGFVRAAGTLFVVSSVARSAWLVQTFCLEGVCGTRGARKLALEPQ